MVRPQDRARRFRALADGLVDAARCDAIADRVPRRAAIPEHGDRVGRVTAHRQDDGVHAVEAALGTREGFVANSLEGHDGVVAPVCAEITRRESELFGHSEVLFPSLNHHLFFPDHVHEFDTDERPLCCIEC